MDLRVDGKMVSAEKVSAPKASAKKIRRVLMIAFHFPPQRGSSGVQRTLAFVRYLGDGGWLPSVLTAASRAHESQAGDQLGDIPPAVTVRRAFALDSARHLAIRGRYLGLSALPDRWISWWLGAVPAGWRMIRRERPDVIWSTYPIATAHLIALALQRISSLPWVADMRDPMLDDEYPRGALARRAAAWIEARTVARCSRLVCTTPGAIRAYRARYPQVPAARFVLIENGYDENNFASAERLAADSAPSWAHPDEVLMVHSGIIYPSERDPRPLFEALAALLEEGLVCGARLRLVLRAPVHDDYLRALIAEHGLEGVVEVAPHLPYREALAEMLRADALLLLQAANCNHQIPAKLYEYLRARRPLLALADNAGDTAEALRSAGIDTIAALDNKQAIMAAIESFMRALADGTAPVPSLEASRAHARSARAAQLATLLSEVVDEAR